MEELKKMYEDMFQKMKEVKKTIKPLEKESQSLKDTIVQLKVMLTKMDAELHTVTNKLSDVEATFAKWNSSTSRLNDVFDQGNDGTTGLGYPTSIDKLAQESMNAKHKKSLSFLKDAPVFVKASGNLDKTNKKMLYVSSISKQVIINLFVFYILKVFPKTDPLKMRVVNL